MSFGHQYQWLYQSVRANCDHKEQERFLMGDSDRLSSPYLQCCTAHSSVNFILVFSTKRAVSILAQGKRRRTKFAYNSSGTQLYMIKFLLLQFQPKEGTRRCVTSPLWILSGCRYLGIRFESESEFETTLAKNSTCSPNIWTKVLSG